METLRHRVSLPLMAALLGAAVGCVAGCLIGRAVIFHQTFTRLDKDDRSIVTRGETSTAESRRILRQMNASSLPACSPAQIAEFRNLAFQSKSLKAAGRMRGDTVACSTASDGKPANPGKRYTPLYRQHDGTMIYLNLDPFRVPEKTVIAVRLGDSFVVYNPYAFHTETPDWMHFTVTDVDRVARHPQLSTEQHVSAPGIELVDEGKARFNQRISVTHCSSDGLVCTTAYTTVAESLGANRYEFAGFLLAGALAGSLFGIASTLLYRKNRGIEKQLLRAISRDELKVVYQPIIDLDTRRIIGAEALVRWTDEGNLAVPPDVFVRIAEEQGFVGKITRLVVRRALDDFAPVFCEYPDFRVNVNIAASDLADPQFIPMLQGALSEAGVSARNLGIEITESYTARQQTAKETIIRLRKNGHIVHIDDFGTGFSSLAYLYELSVDGIKIDRAFVRAIGTEAVTVTILPQILSMARQLNLQVTVEGIEAPEQAAYFTRTSQQVLAQGWLFGRPIPAEDFLRKLELSPVIDVPSYSPAIVDAIAV